MTTPANLPSQIGVPGGAPTDVLSIALFLSQFSQAVNGWIARAANAVNWLLQTKASANGIVSSQVLTTTTGAISGLQVTLTPTSTGRVLVVASGIFGAATTASIGCSYHLYYAPGGTQTAGTVVTAIPGAISVGMTQTPTDGGWTAGGIYPGWALNWVFTGLKAGTEYTFGVVMYCNVTPFTMFESNISAVEI